MLTGAPSRRNPLRYFSRLRDRRLLIQLERERRMRHPEMSNTALPVTAPDFSVLTAHADGYIR